jgi:hypothetical protein
VFLEVVVQVDAASDVLGDDIVVGLRFEEVNKLYNFFDFIASLERSDLVLKFLE